MSACTDPKVTASSYTPADSQVLTAIPFIAEFSLVCGNGEKHALYANIDGILVPVTQSIEGDKYQVSWTKDVKAAKTGDHSVALYDSEGYSSIKRSRERGEAVTAAPLVTIVVNYAGSYTGPLLNSEHIAACLAAAVFYLAFSSRSKLLA
jgi:translocon-associated protein subunit delta